jgi:Raf kinase inhibitor-like YbhB/YbcL family protein
MTIRVVALGSAFGVLIACGLLSQEKKPPRAQQAKPDAFTVTVPGMAEAAFLTTKNASSDPGCGGGNVSPPIQWSHPPAGTKSFAITVVDPDGQKGLGSIHWVAYGIPASITSLPAGVGTSSSKDLIAGKNSAGKATYRGPCPPAGEQPHHYIVGVYALDLAPGAIEPGLTHEALLAAIKGHSLNESSVVLRYAR